MMNEADAIAFELTTRPTPTFSNNNLTGHREREFDHELYGTLLALYTQSKLPFSQILYDFYKEYYRPMYDGKCWRWASYKETQGVYFQEVQNVIARHLTPNSCVIDIGAGTGQLGRFLSSHFTELDFNCFDKMPNAVKLVNAIADRENSSVKANYFDFDSKYSKFPRNCYFISSYSLMYLQDPKLFFQKLLVSNPLGGFFFEPIFSDYIASPYATRKMEYFKANRYSGDWYEVFCNLLFERSNFEIKYHEKHFFAHNSLLPISAVVWMRSAA